MKAKIKKINSEIEGEVTLIIDDQEIKCFAVYCPLSIREKCVYEIELSFTFIDGANLKESQTTLKYIKKSNHGYTYEINGFLEGNKLDAGIVFEDSNLFEDYYYLDGKFVNFTVHRLDASFLKKVDELIQ